MKFHIHRNSGELTPRSTRKLQDVFPCHQFIIHFRFVMTVLCTCVVDVYVDGRLDVRPDNTAVVSGQSTTLRCHTDTNSSRYINWHRRVVNGSSDELVVLSCQRESVFTSVYTLTSDNSGQCDLTINSVTTSLTGYYICRDASDIDEQKAYVTIIGKLLTVVMFIVD